MLPETLFKDHKQEVFMKMHVIIALKIKIFNFYKEQLLILKCLKTAPEALVNNAIFIIGV